MALLFILLLIVSSPQGLPLWSPLQLLNAFFFNFSIWLLTKEFALWTEEGNLWLQPSFFVCHWCSFLHVGLMRRGRCSSWEHVVSWKPSASVQRASPHGERGQFHMEGTLWERVLPLPVSWWELFSYRWTYQEFFSRYRVLMKQKDVLSDRKQTCKNVLEKLILVRRIFIYLHLNRYWPKALWL